LLKPLLILCLGNEIISDDRFGPEIADRLHQVSGLDPRADVVYLPIAGFALLDLLAGRKKVLIVDTMVTGRAPAGTLHSFPAGVLTATHHLTTSHQISLPTALELGRQLGLEMPTVIDVIAVEPQDIETLSEELTPPVRAALDETVQFIQRWITQNADKESDHES